MHITTLNVECELYHYATPLPSAPPCCPSISAATKIAEQNLGHSMWLGARAGSSVVQAAYLGRAVRGEMPQRSEVPLAYVFECATSSTEGRNSTVSREDEKCPSLDRKQTHAQITNRK